MKNKLLLSSALVGSLAIAGIASAQTTISGSLDLSYKTISNEGSFTKRTDAGFGREAQINIQNKGKLSNGLDYAAGFALEFDGKSGNAQSSTSAVASTDDAHRRISRENTYMDIIMGTTTFSVGMDHLNNMSFSSAPRVAQHASTTVASAQLTTGSTDLGAGVNSGGVAYLFYPGAATLGNSNSMGLGVQQVTPFGTITGQYFPRATVQQASNDGVPTGDIADAYELHFRGDLGVKGLSVNLGRNVVTAPTAGVANVGENQKGTAMGIGYNLGQVAVGIQQNKTDNNSNATDSKIDTKSVEIGATFAATKEISIGLTHVKTDGTFRATSNAKMAADEKIKSLTVGYNLGAITMSATAAKLEDARGIAGRDSDIVLVRAGTRF
jgi:uncharacterized protein (DUF736 family)